MGVSILIWMVTCMSLLGFLNADPSQVLQRLTSEEPTVADLLERQQEFDDFKSQVLELLQQRENDRNQIEQLTRAILGVKNTVDELNDAKARHEEEIGELKETIAELSDMKFDHDKEIKDLKATVADIMKGTNDERITDRLMNDRENLTITTSEALDNDDDLLDVKEDLAVKADELNDINETEKKDMHRISKDSVSIMEWLSEKRLRATGLKTQHSGSTSYPSFTACITAPDITLGANQHVLFNGIITNNGGHYSSTTGIFRAPFNGVYVFHLSLMTSPGKSMYVVIKKDGHAFDDVYSDAIKGSYDSVSETWLLNLQRGSQVWIAAKSAGDIHGYCHTQFTGFLLHSWC